MRKALLLVLVGVLLVSGCLCCGVNLPFGSGGSDEGNVDEESGEETSTDDGATVTDDSGESSDTSMDEGATDEGTTDTTEPEVESTTTTIAEEGGSSEVTSTTQPAVTTTIGSSYSPTYDCVKNAGYNPDAVIFGYSKNCGSNTQFMTGASMASKNTGVTIVKVNIGGYLDANKLKMLECFFGKYSEANKNVFAECPRLLCPKTGRYETMSGLMSSTPTSQFCGFA